MNLYGFVLGTNHSLCKVEICSVLEQNKIDFKIIAASEEILIIEAEKVPEINAFGSTAKLVKFYKDLNEIVCEIPSKSKSVTYGVSVYNGGGKFKQLNQLWYEAPRIAREVRDIMREYRIKGGFLPLKDRFLSTVSVNENLLKEDGFELVLASGKDQTFIGKTMEVQHYEEYSKRDYGRPERDDKSGMIPPKIAKMMINLAKIPKETNILDPFCGSGTFLQEEILLGFENVAGSDLDIKAVEKSKRNLEWQFGDKKINIRSIDALQLSKYYKEIEAIISEPFLGSPRLRVMRRDQVFKERENLEKFYENIFEEFHKVLINDGKIVFILPVIRYKNEFLYLDIFDKIERIGFKKQNYCEKQKELGLNLTERGTIVYYRPGQTVSREIVIFNKI